MRPAIALLLAAGLAVLGVPGLGGMVSLGAQTGAQIIVSGFAGNSQVTLVNAAGNVIATGVADTSGGFTFTGVQVGNFTVVGVNTANAAVASTVSVSAAAVAAGTTVVATVATAAAAATAAGAAAVAAVTAATAGALGAVGGVLGATLIAAGIAAGTAGIVVAQGNTVTICHVLGGGLAPNTLQVNQNVLAAHLGHGDTEGGVSG